MNINTKRTSMNNVYSYEGKGVKEDVPLQYFFQNYVVDMKGSNHKLQY